MVLCFILLFLGCAEQLADQRFRRGEALWRNGNGISAVKELKAVLRYEPPIKLKQQTLLLISTIASGSLQDPKMALWAHEERLKITSDRSEKYKIQKAM